MLYLACLIRARELEDKSGWSEDVSPLRVVNRGQSSLLPPSQPWSTALFEFIPAFSIRREIALMKESCTYCMYNSRDDIVYVFGKVIESLKNPAEILATFFRVGEKRDESIAFASSSCCFPPRRACPFACRDDFEVIVFRGDRGIRRSDRVLSLNLSSESSAFRSLK